MSETHKFPLPSAEREDIEEALGLVWHRRECGVPDGPSVKEALTDAVGPGAYGMLVERGFAREEGETLILTPEGETLAADVTRRHRLAERLLTDILNLDRTAVDPNACILEHIISPEVSERICTLLGHPAECPHGRAIPPGDCCRRREERLEPVVTALGRMAPGDRGRVAYLQLRDHPELHRLLSLGMIPGASLHLHQTYPAFVVDVGESQLALEEGVANRIFVHRS